MDLEVLNDLTGPRTTVNWGQMGLFIANGLIDALHPKVFRLHHFIRLYGPNFTVSISMPMARSNVNNCIRQSDEGVS